jgi:AcrR family transcriptional regulator
MPRHMPDDRFDQLIDCATKVFIQQGYRHTQMADIAEAMGIAKGTLYLYVRSKEVLFDLVCREADVPSPRVVPPKLPLAAANTKTTIRNILSRLSKNRVAPALAAALERQRVIDPKLELESILLELYEMLSPSRRVFRLLERSATDLPELGALWFDGVRGRLVELMAQYLERRIRAGLLRPVPDIRAAALLSIETMLSRAVDREGDLRSEAASDAVARDTAIHFIVSTFI